MALRTVAVVLACLVALSAAGQSGPAPSPPQTRALGGTPPPSMLPPLTEEAEGILEQWELARVRMIEQLRFLQLRYRDAGRAEDAAAIAARARQLQGRPAVVTGPATAELVNDGLQTRDDPVQMPAFRHQSGQILSFAIRGRADQPVYGTAAYADESGLETAAVHAGLIRDGQRGIVRVKPLPGEDFYDGSTQNGVQSARYGRSAGSFRFVSVAVSKPNRTSSMSSYRDLVNESITLSLVGSTGQRVWGDTVYSDDSSPSAAAVHAGILADGEFGWVRISILPGQARYPGASRNGVTSEASGPWDGSFRVDRAAAPYIVELPGGEDASRVVNLGTLRGRPDAGFVVQVVGSVQGNVWGTAVAYTDDSSISTAAVHSGLLKDGEMGFVRVILLPGRDRYTAAEGNGVRSQDYGPWQGSFRLESAVR